MEKQIINVYCDESCHLEHDRQRAMVFGCIRYPQEKVRELSEQIRKLKQKHFIYKFAEIKWTKVSKSKEDFFFDLLNLFLDTEELKFRAVVFKNKDLHKLEHSRFPNQTYQKWYFKMFYLTLNKVIESKYKYCIYLDKQTADNRPEMIELEKHLSNKGKILKIQNVLSHESEMIQLTDFITGIISYANRDAIKLPTANQTKVKLVEIFRAKTNLSLISATPLSADKINLFTWEPDYYETRH